MPVGPTNAPAVMAAVPTGWGPYGRPGYPMPMMPTPIPYGPMPYGAHAPLAPQVVAGGVSQREALLETQVQQMEKRLRDLETRLQRDD